jgi:DNA topoisomerase-2
LKPNGQFGTRLQGGKDSASERYIFTQLSKCTRYLFRKEDDNVLEYLVDDGTSIEPAMYYPIIPMILVNGCNGIGTGFSTKIPCYNPVDLINYIRHLLLFEPTQTNIKPFYRGFKGKIDQEKEDCDGKYIIRGVYSVKDLNVTITELPIGTWTDDYKELLETLTDTTDKNGNKISPIVKDYTDMCKDTTIHFIITLHKGKLEELQKVDKGQIMLEKVFKLNSSLSTSNMHLFNEKGELIKYENVGDIIDDFIKVRYKTYEERKQYIIKKLEEQILFLENRVNYLNENIEGTIDLRMKKEDEITHILEEKGYHKLGDSHDYKYLTRMTMDSVSKENIEKKTKELNVKKEELHKIMSQTVEELWLSELIKLEKELGIKKKIKYIDV